MATLLHIPLKYLDDQALRELRRIYPDAMVWIEVDPNLGSGAAREVLFWTIIDALNLDKTEPDEALWPAVKLLGTFPVGEIQGFQDLLDLNLHKLDLIHHNIKVKAIIQDDFSGESNFLYACCGVIAKGRDYFIQVMQSPTWGWGPPEFSFPPLLSLANDAFYLKTGLPDLRYRSPAVVGWGN